MREDDIELNCSLTDFFIFFTAAQGKIFKSYKALANAGFPSTTILNFQEGVNLIKTAFLLSQINIWL